jgi:hypothetical protein
MRHVALTVLMPVALLTSCVLCKQGREVTVTFTPEAIGVECGAVQNAGTGSEIWFGGPADGVTNLVRYAVRVSPYSANAMIRVGWDAYESGPGEYHFDRMDSTFARCLKYGQKLNIGCFLTSNAGTKQKLGEAFCCYPAYVHEAMQRSAQKDVINELWLSKQKHWEPNFENAYFFERYDALLKAFAEYLERPITVDGKTVSRKKLIRCIEMRHFGFWGEGAYPKSLMPTDSACLIRFADAFVRHFPDIRLMVPTNGMRFSPSYDALQDYHFHLLALRNRAGLAGMFRDNWGDNEKRYQALYYAANRYEKNGIKMFELLRDRWKTAPLVGEPGRWGPTPDGFHPYWGLYDQVAYLHPAVIRNCNVSDGKSSTNPTEYTIFNDPQALDAFHRMYAIIGFRYVVAEVRVARRDRRMKISVDWKNIGLTPTYDAWKVRYFMTDGSGNETWSNESALDLRTVMPDERVAPGKLGGAVVTQTDCFPDVPMGNKVWLQIVDPDNVSPPMALGIRGRSENGAYLLTP